MTQDIHIRQFDTVRRARRFLDSHADKLTPEITAIYEHLQQHADRLEDLWARQMPGFDPAAHRRKHADALRGEMLRLAASVRRLFQGDPVMRRALQIPHKRAGMDRIMSAADAMCAALEPHADFLRSERVDVRRLERIRSRADEIATLTRLREATTPKRQVMAREFTEVLKQAMMAKASIGRLVVELPSFPVVTWQSTARVQKRMGRPKRKPSRGTPPAGDDVGQ